MLYAPFIKVTVVDSTYEIQPPLVAIIIVPRGREHDRLYSSKAGYLRLQERFFNVSRLFIVANYRNGEALEFSDYQLFEVIEDDKKSAEEGVLDLLKPLTPSGLQSSQTRFVTYCDGLLHRWFISKGVRLDLGAFVVTDEVISINGKFEVRRRLRFNNTADLIHLEVRTDQGGTKEDLIKKHAKEDEGYKLDIHEILEPHNRAVKSSLEAYQVSAMNILNEYHRPQPKVKKHMLEFREKSYGNFDLLLMDIKHFQSGSGVIKIKVSDRNFVLLATQNDSSSHGGSTSAPKVEEYVQEFTTQEI
ncbi:hypothetical protein L1987_34888 [Smallanthus sonchifolius]|uniref:Uncharacterized protein n=1 Tax=Smallanthus sonchifolius TaxID=185202 RepID=A0ACB9HUX5_9ASTR|nr:hypothetical protein L1987_34888 [Smallanthus sonchifolius]